MGNMNEFEKWCLRNGEEVPPQNSNKDVELYLRYLQWRDYQKNCNPVD